MASQLPIVNHSVQYCDSQGIARAAIITEVVSVGDGTEKVGLFVIWPDRTDHLRDISFGESDTLNTWHWPERT